VHRHLRCYVGLGMPAGSCQSDDWWWVMAMSSSFILPLREDHFASWPATARSPPFIGRQLSASPGGGIGEQVNRAPLRHRPPRGSFAAFVFGRKAQAKICGLSVIDVINVCVLFMVLPLSTISSLPLW
jgi:hypothetical protein